MFIKLIKCPSASIPGLMRILLYRIDLIKGDIFYTFSDGYIDQFGGPEEKKFLSKQFREYLLTIHKENLKTQQQLLKEKIIDWMSNTTQIDDILVMGIKI